MEDSEVLDRALHTQPMPQVPGRAVFPVSPAPAPRTLVDIVMDTVSRHPDAVALDDGTTVLSYAEFLERVEAQAQRLWDLDIGRGDRVGIRVPSGTVDLYVAVLGTIFAGAAYVPVDFDDPDERANTVWEEASVCAVYGADLSLRPRTGVRAGADCQQPGRPMRWPCHPPGCSRRSTGAPRWPSCSHGRPGCPSRSWPTTCRTRSS